MMNFLITLCLIISSLVFGLSASRPRNVLLLVGDDAGFQSQVYNNSVCKTPALNALAKRSLVFDQAFTSVSSCSPSRSAILSGLPQHQNGMYGLHNAMHHFNSFDGLKTLPTLLHKHGIRTGIVGKKHVGPGKVYPFDYAVTEEEVSILQAGRNVTFMKEKVADFLSTTPQSQPFFLYIGFHDPHRCGSTDPKYGEFCEKFGNGEAGMGVIPDWKPLHYTPDEVVVPDFVQDTPASRADLAAMYTTISRLDTGIALILNELEKAGKLNDTLVLYTSDNGISFPNGRTNLYTAGIAEPFLLSSPKSKSSWGKRSGKLVSLLDIVPTVLDWFSIKFRPYKLEGRYVTLTGTSLLSHLQTDSVESMYTQDDVNETKAVYASHDLHEVTMYYPMRSIRTNDFQLIHNLNFQAPFGIDQNFYVSPTFQDLLNRTKSKSPLYWSKTLHKYYYRPEWELFYKSDLQQLNNLAYNPDYKHVFEFLKSKLHNWQNITSDPWLCAPWGIYEYQGKFKARPRCLPLLNEDSEHKSFETYQTARIGNNYEEVKEEKYISYLQIFSFSVMPQREHLASLFVCYLVFYISSLLLGCFVSYKFGRNVSSVQSKHR